MLSAISCLSFKLDRYCLHEQTDSAAIMTERIAMKLVLWLLLFVLCWPLALLALLLYPLFWLLSLPFRLVGLAVEGVFDLLRALVLLPSRLLRLGR